MSQIDAESQRKLDEAELVANSALGQLTLEEMMDFALYHSRIEDDFRE